MAGVQEHRQLLQRGALRDRLGDERDLRGLEARHLNDHLQRQATLRAFLNGLRLLAAAS
jgi:hypothetical protein